MALARHPVFGIRISRHNDTISRKALHSPHFPLLLHSMVTTRCGHPLPRRRHKSMFQSPRWWDISGPMVRHREPKTMLHCHHRCSSHWHSGTFRISRRTCPSCLSQHRCHFVSLLLACPHCSRVLLSDRMVNALHDSNAASNLLSIYTTSSLQLHQVGMSAADGGSHS